GRVHSSRYSEKRAALTMYKGHLTDARRGGMGARFLSQPLLTKGLYPYGEARTWHQARLRRVRHSFLRPDQNPCGLPEMRHRTAGRTATTASRWRQCGRGQTTQETRAR